MVEQAVQTVLDDGHGEILIKITDHRVMQIETTIKKRCVVEIKENKNG